jgi:hypothetical protein
MDRTDELSWPTYLRPIERGAADGPYAHWWLFEDDEADEALNGKRIDLVMKQATLSQPAEIIGRRPA